MSLAYLYRVCNVLLERKCYFIHLILEINMVFNSFGVSLINVVLYKILLITFCASKSSIFCQNLSEHDLKYSRRFVHSDATRWTIEWVIAKSLLIGGGATTTMTHYLILQVYLSVHTCLTLERLIMPLEVHQEQWNVVIIALRYFPT